MSAIAACNWLPPGGKDAALRIADFLGQIGVPVIVEPVAKSLLAGIDVREGAVRIDPELAVYPGDLLHEAGHYAVTEPALRAGLASVADDPGEEMAAIAWSAAAATACGIDLAVLFHDGGYDGGSAAMRAAFADGAAGPGAPLLAWYGMVAPEGYPAMARWLR